MGSIQLTAVPALEDNYIWIITQAHNDYAIVVDPGESAPVLQFLSANNLTLSAVLITHHHADHTAGVHSLQKKYQCPVFSSNTKHTWPQHSLVRAGEICTTPGLSLDFTIIGIPGHTSDHIAFLYGNNLLCGDTLFAGGMGRIFEGTPSQMYQSIQKISALPDDTMIYCAHEYTVANLCFAQHVEPNNTAISQRLDKARRIRAQNGITIPSQLAEEKATNPFLRAHIDSVQHAVQRQFPAMNAEANTLEIFTALRHWKSNFTS